MISTSKLYQHPVTWVTLSLFLVVSPHLERFPGWSIILLIALFLWRLLCINYNKLSLPKWFLVLIVMMSAFGLFTHFGTLFGKTAGSVFLCILLAIKLHESSTTRDYMILISLSFFIIVTNFLFSQSIPTVLFMLCLVVMLVMSMVTINQGEAQLPIEDKLRFSLKITLQSVPLMLVLFVLFPRMSTPLWSLPQEQNVAQSGLSDSMSPGNISKLIQSNNLAFRVKFKDQPPEQHYLYWRALVLWHFDGTTWEQGKVNRTPAPKLQAAKPVIEYTVTLEPHFQTWLFGLDIPVDVPADIIYTNNFLLRKKDAVTSLYQYTLSSSLDYMIQPRLSPWEESAGLKIPEGSNAKTVALGRQLAEKYTKPADRVRHMLNMYNREAFHYTLYPPTTPGFDPVDQFLFDTRRGFCEHYASSFTLVMRAAGVPARIVTGYQGGTYNPISKVVTVRQKDAHAWSEVWLEGQGWVRIDPTASVARARIESSLDDALPDNETRPFHMQINKGLLQQAMFYIDAIDARWNQWVVGYDFNLQQSLVSSFLSGQKAIADLVMLMLTGFGIILLILAVNIIKPWKRIQKKDPVQKVYMRFCKKLKAVGIERYAHEGPLDFASRASRLIPAKKDSIMLISQLYIRLRYQASPTAKQLQQLKQHVAMFRAGKKGSVLKQEAT